MSASKLSEQIVKKLAEENGHCCGDVLNVHDDQIAAALDEMAVRVFEDTRERAAKIAADAIAPNRRDIADAIRAMQPE